LRREKVRERGWRRRERVRLRVVWVSDMARVTYVFILRGEGNVVSVEMGRMRMVRWRL
jgi:hypothetical protein